MGLLNIYKRIQKDLQRGISRVEIFNSLSAKKPGDAPKFAYMLASIPYPELRRKYLKPNAVLFLLLLALPVFTLLARWPVNFKEPTLFLAIQLIVPLVFSYFVFHFHGGIYRLLAFWCGMDLLESILLLEFSSAMGLIKTVILFSVVCLSLVIARKVFFNLKILGPKTDPDGNFLL